MAAKRPRAGQPSREGSGEVSARTTRYVEYQGKRWQVRGRDRQTGNKRLTRMTEQGMEEALVDPAELEAITTEEEP